MLLLWAMLSVGCGTSSVPDPDSPAVTASRVTGKRVQGYWHNWHSEQVPYFRLHTLPEEVNTVLVAFATPDPEGSGRILFKPHEVVPGLFELDIRSIQKRGDDVLISIGGSGHPLELDTPKQKEAFIDSVRKIVDRYGFDGIDLNLEDNSMVLDPGDNDFRNPTTPKILHLIEAVRELRATYGEHFIITVAPEVVYVTRGYVGYGKKVGGYLPFIHAVREDINWVHMQLYNAGGQYLYDPTRSARRDIIVDASTADFVVGMTHMLIEGFPVGKDPKNWFPGLGAQRVAVGLPCNRKASFNGAMTSKHFEEAITFLLSGEPSYDSRLPASLHKAYPELVGVMNWSLNWDAVGSSQRKPWQFLQEANSLLNPTAPRK
jgi:chitinase